VLDKPAEMFDRDREWGALTRFAADPQPGATLGVVSGRRRQGKSFLLQGLCEQAGGFYWCAQEGTDAESLAFLGEALAQFLDSPAPLRFDDWRTAIDALLALGRDRPLPVVIDEFPYLAKANHALPSIIQAAYGPLRPERHESRTRLLLCGSAMSFMGRILAGDAPLRGRAGLDLVVRPLDHQLAAEFWGIDDPRLALQVGAVLGGTPAYRREFVRNDTPADLADFDDWVVRTVLDPSSPLFREARYLLADEAEINDTALYHSVLAAVATGNNTRSGIAGYIGRKATDIAHPLTVLEDIGLLARETDAFRSNRSHYRIAEPLITFYHAIMRPVWPELERSRDLHRIWQRARKRYASNVLGPHFERVCREWTWHMAPPGLFGDHPNKVAAGTVADPANKTSHELDLVVFGLGEDDSSPLIAIGEAKSNDTIGIGHLERLRRIRTLLTDQQRPGAHNAKLACYSGAGFTDQLHQVAADHDDVLLIGLDEIYIR
jgi:AAA+ ATPase superfamily predicted ATPase